MSRRKQAKPRSFKPELETRTTPLVMVPDEPVFLDEPDFLDDHDVALAATDHAPGPYEGNVDRNFNPRSPFHIEKQETNDSLESETLGTDQGSSSRSETPEDPQTSPTPSSCATPNSTTDLPDAELSFTVGITETTPYACQFCDKAFPRLSFLKKHEQTHGDHMPFRCEFCSRLFKHKRSRDRHIKLHTGDKKYRCTHCEAAFSRSDHLKIHMKTHDTQKPFQCTVCNRGYNTAAALTSHMQNHKRQRPETPAGTACASNSAKTPVTVSEESVSSPDSYHCSQCGDTFKKQDHLQNHIVNAHGSNLLSPEDSVHKSVSLVIPDQILPQLTPKLACIYCTKDSFTTMDQLQGHVQSMHSSILNGDLREFSRGAQMPRSNPLNLMTPPPPLIPVNGHLPPSSLLYSCDMCTMRFPTIHRLRKHSVAVHGHCDFTRQKEISDSVHPSPLVCVQCALPFHTSTAFTDHYLMVHGGSSPSLSAVSPVPEQVKPTDLSRKNRRSSSIDRKSKRMCVKEDGSSRLDLMTPNAGTAQYEYPSMFLCNQCDAALPDFESFRNHLKSHLEQTGGIRSFLHTSGSTILDNFQQENLKVQNNCICPHCGTTFKDLVSCEQHVYAHFLKTAIEFGCQSCLTMFPNTDELHKHLFEIHTHHLFRCSVCKEMFDSKVAIKIHFNMKHSTECKVFRCSTCPNLMFHTELEFTVHVRTVHGAHTLLSALQSHSKTLRCMFCRQVFGSDLEMQFHLATHTKQFRCPICSESFQIEFLLDRHIQTYHSNTRNINGENDDSIDGEKSIKKSSSNSPHQIGKTHSSPGRTSQKSSSGENNNVKKQHEVSQLNNCDICERNDFSNETELVAHRKLVHHARNNTKNGVVSLHCAYCNENCKTRTELENHMKSHSQSSGVSGKHKCNICDEICPSAVLLAEHKLTHCKVISGNCCTQCKANLTNEEQFYSHLVQHSNNNNNGSNQKSKSQVALPTPCVICRQTLISEVEVRIHAQFHLRNTMQQAEFQCSICFKIVDVQNVIITNGSYMCSECYSSPNESQQRNFHCNECQFAFDTSAALEQHMDSVHSKTYTCTKCEAVFDSERDVHIHISTHLMAEGGNNHECHLCRRLFSSPMKLQAHLIEHTFAGCGGFTCYLCSAVFTGAQGLQAHIIEHGLAARPYDCPQCNLKFFFRAELDNHSYSHLSRGSRTPVEVDVALMSPKAYYVSVNGKYDPSKNGELSKYYIKDQKNKKDIKNDGTEVQNQKSHSENAASENEEKPIVKEEPNEETDDRKEVYVDVDFPTTSTKFKNELSSVGESSTYESGEVPNLISD